MQKGVSTGGVLFTGRCSCLLWLLLFCPMILLTAPHTVGMQFNLKSLHYNHHLDSEL